MMESLSSFRSEKSLNPLKRVKFISIGKKMTTQQKKIIVSIPSNGSSLFQSGADRTDVSERWIESQSPQTGQVYFNQNERVSYR